MQNLFHTSAVRALARLHFFIDILRRPIWCAPASSEAEMKGNSKFLSEPVAQ
jgi:hypothetical protein